MEAFGDALRQAQDKIKVADYSLGKVFPMTKDPSVIRSVLVNLHEAQVRSLDALLLFERTFKRVPAYPVGHLETKLRLFSEYCVTRYGLNEEMASMIREARQWSLLAQGGIPTITPNARVLFRGEGFEVSSTSLPAIKALLAGSSSFVEQVAGVIAHAGGD